MTESSESVRERIRAVEGTGLVIEEGVLDEGLDTILAVL